MLRFLPRIRESQKLFLEKNPTSQASFEEQIEELYQRQYDITSPVFFHQRQVRYDRHRPYISPVMTYVSESCVLIGDIQVGRMSVLLPGSVIRAESSRSAIGDNVFIAENTFICQSLLPLNPNHDGSFMIGDGVAIGPNCILRGCTIEPHAYVGEGCQILDGATVETCSVLLPGSVLPEGAVVKEDEVWGGSPAKFIRHTTEEEQEKMYAWVMDQYQIFNKLRVEEAEPQTLSRYFIKYWDNLLRQASGERSRYERPRFNFRPPPVFFTNLKGEDDGSRPPKSYNPYKQFVSKFE